MPLTLKFLIDECLSPVLADHLRRRGFHAEHVNDVKRKRSRKRFSDRQATAYAIERDLIVVTNNASDFENIYRGRPVHPGLVILLAGPDPHITREDQVSMLDAALEAVGTSEPIQEVIRVELVNAGADAIDVVVTRSEFPSHSVVVET